MTTTADHPDWCEPALCDAEVPTLPAAGGVHRGNPERLVLVLPMGDAISVTAQLQLPGHRAVDDADRDAYLAVQVAGGPLTPLPMDQARLVVERLAPLLGLTVSARV
ncbi:hypothetical protein AB0M35_18150 [Micromonospora sp. NPDC051196]|uniref:hypothetical protein n=1 Tax=Micromonospora sp. NPDC051196 TaxID=3155281 RepID=UPI00341921E3